MRQLRLGLVCYGGVSLAIYMHGVVRELFNLVQASKAVATQDPNTNPYAATDTRHVYWEVLKNLRTDDVRQEVVIDIISGTSAGGINGIILAKALAHALPMDALRMVWFNKASILRLLGLGRLIINGDGILSGRRMLGWAYDALTEMSGQIRGSSYLPDGHRLHLFVTTTDFHGYPLTIRTHDPDHIDDFEHRHVLRFAFEKNVVDQFGGTADRALAFSVRATSSFPSAFPPTVIADLDRLPGSWSTGDRNKMKDDYFARYVDEPDVDPEKACFIDGGVLNNRPFDLAVDAILMQPAQSEVDRRLVFIEPHPKQRQIQQTGAPGIFTSASQALGRVPRYQPIIDALQRLEDHNRAVAAITQLVEKCRPDVEQLLTNMVPGSLTFQLNDSELEQLRISVQKQIIAIAGPAYPTYVRLKVDAILEAFAEALARLTNSPPDSRRARFLRDITYAWGRRSRFVSDPEVNAAFMQWFDFPFKRRRLKFLISFISSLYNPRREFDGTEPPRETIDALKGFLYDEIMALLMRMSVEFLPPEYLNNVREIFSRTNLSAADDDPEVFVQQFGDQIDMLVQRLGEYLNQFSGLAEHRRIYDRFRSSDLHPLIQREVLLRYLGFSFFDVYVYPLLSLSGIGELDEIEVIRISPDDATSLSTEPAEQRLFGAKWGHFKAFFRRTWREQDYLWGRLDGAERVIDILEDVAGPGVFTATQVSGQKTACFAAVLAEEENTLTTRGARTLIAELRTKLQQPPPAQSGSG